MKNKFEILHCIDAEPKFMQSFIDFVKDHFNYSQHKFIIREHFSDMSIDIDDKTVFLPKSYSKIKRLLIFMYHMNKSEKIILHGLFHSDILFMLFLQPWLLKKCYWVMWGGDFYFPETQSWIKKQVIKKMGHLVTWLEGEYELSQKWYGTKGECHECFMYPSNLYKEYVIKQKTRSSINIQLGNSATKTNNHIDILEKLKKYKDKNIKIFTPLSYGDEEYAKDVILYGKELFGDKFVPLTKFMPFEKYLEFLSEIDIAIFAHKRQQAMGNTITLLGLGKKVYMRSDITPWQLFYSMGVKVFDVRDIQIDVIDQQTKQENQQKIKEYFSEENLKRQLARLFNE